MSNEIVFRTQLTSIMEVLANAAVEEICKLVNDGYAILNLEISEYQKENESLKMQLHMMELKAAQGCVERVTARENSLTNCFDGAAGENPRGTSKEGPNLAAKRVFGSSRGFGPPAPHRIRDQFAETENTRNAPILIKEENSEECSDPKTDLDIHGQGASEPSAGDAEVDPVAMGVEVSPSPVRADEMDELHGTGHSVWECADMEEGRTEPLLIKEERLEEESDPLEELIREEREGTGSGPSSVKSLTVTHEVMVLEPTPAKVQAAMPSAWNREPAWGSVRTQNRHCHEARKRSKTQADRAQTGRRESRAVLDAGGLPPSDESFTAAQSLAVNHPWSGKERRTHLCKYCGKAFNFVSEMKIHLRVHTGEKPYHCAQCGRAFRKSCGLTKHQRIHTGERPYSCPQCGKKFSDGSNLRRHLNIHAGYKLSYGV